MRPERLHAGPTMVPVTLDDTSTLLRVADGSKIGTLGERQAKILHELEEVDGINFQLYCQIKREEALGGGKFRMCAEKELQHLLCTIIYGPLRLFDAIGEYVSECELYLQDPLHCNRDVPYRNPHLLSGLDEESPMTFSFNQPSVPLEVEELNNRPDLFAQLRSEDPLRETTAPPALRTMLYGYDRLDDGLRI